MSYDGNNPGQSTLNEVEQLGKFVREMIAVDGGSNNNKGALFDSAVITNATLQHINTASVPAALDRVLGKVDGGSAVAANTAGCLLAIIDQVGALYDSASSSHHDQFSLVPAAPQAVRAMNALDPRNGGWTARVGSLPASQLGAPLHRRRLHSARRVA